MASPNEEKKQVAFVHPDLGIGGAERLVLDVAETLKSQDYNVFFIVNHFDKQHSFKELQSGHYHVQIIGDWIPRNLFGKFQALCAYVRMIYLITVYLIFFKKKNQPDVFFVDLIPIAIPFLKWANQRVVYYCHHPDLLASLPGNMLKKLYRAPINWVEMKATKQADVILVNSKYTSDIFQQTFPEIQRQLHIVYPTVSHSYLETIEQITPKPIYEIVPEIRQGKYSNIVFLSINRFHPAKKIELAINALSELKIKISKEDWNRIYLILAGGYDPISNINFEYYRELMHLVENKELSDKVILIKSPSDNFKAELLLACTCLIYTPVNEHFGIVPLEAMAAGKPVIACNSGGPRETVENGKTGYLCDATAESLADFMSRIIEGKDTEQMGTCGKHRFKQHFSCQQFSTTLQNVLLSITK